MDFTHSNDFELILTKISNYFFRLPSKHSDKNASTKKTSTKQEIEAPIPIATRTNPMNSLEKLKRVDSSFQREPDTSTISLPNTRSTPKQATETIRARITSITPELVTEKRAKFLSGISSISPHSHGEQKSSDAWSELKTVGEVNHNNVTFNKLNIGEESIKSGVSGKLDIEDNGEKILVEPVTTTTTERSTIDEHETQLQKQKFGLNSSRIDEHVQQDNSLTSMQSTSYRPSLSIGTKATISQQGGRIATIHQNVNGSIEQAKNRLNLETTTHLVKATPMATTKIRSDEETTDKTTEKDIPWTTEEEAMFTTTTDEINETTIGDQTTVTTIVAVKPTKAKISEKIVSATDPATESPGTTENVEMSTITPSIEIATEMANQENITSTDSVMKNINSTTIAVSSSTVALLPSDTESSTVVDVIKPTKPIVTKPTEKIVTKLIDNEKLNQRTVSITSTQKNEQKTTLSSVVQTTETKRVETDVKEGAHGEEEKITPDSASAITTTTTMNTNALKGALSTQSTPIVNDPDEPTDINAMIAIGISIVAVVTLILLVGFLFVMRKRQKQLTYGQRCRPIGLDAYSLDNVSVYNSVRRKNAMRTSKRAFGNAAFDDPALKNNPLNIAQLATFSQKRVSINEEFRDIPLVTARIEEVPIGCEDKNR